MPEKENPSATRLRAAEGFAKRTEDRPRMFVLPLHVVRVAHHVRRSVGI